MTFDVLKKSMQRTKVVAIVYIRTKSALLFVLCLAVPVATMK